MTDEKQRQIFARNLTRYVAESGKSQKEVAAILGFNYKTFSGWCRALSMPTMGKVQALADYFGIGKTDLLDDHTDEPEDSEYYLNSEARDLAQFLLNNPEYKVLFDASRKVKKEDIQFVKDLMDRMISS